MIIIIIIKIWSKEQDVEMNNISDVRSSDVLKGDAEGSAIQLAEYCVYIQTK